MKCPLCGTEDMTISVEVGITIPSKYAYLLSKKVLRRKDCKITHAGWPKATVKCNNCNYFDRGL